MRFIKGYWRFIAVALAAGILAWVGYGYYQENVKLVPEELLDEALKNTLAASSYRYDISVRLTVDGREEKLSQVTGERDAQGNFHVQGEMTGQPTEAYQIEDTTYLKDPVTSKWMVIPGNNLFQQELFMAEINPVAMLNISQPRDLEYLGKQEGQGGQVYVLKLRPQVVENRFLNIYAQDFTYSLHISRNNRHVSRAEVEATSKANTNTRIFFTVDFFDYNARIAIEPPVQGPASQTGR
ncbi:MAG: hypothetical protein D9V47_11550 [Clostridia bacterium]|nr:MAG: hypothetical protein D9V47_11550 [Clostridia bacterium]